MIRCLWHSSYHPLSKVKDLSQPEYSEEHESPARRTIDCLEMPEKDRINATTGIVFKI